MEKKYGFTKRNGKKHIKKSLELKSNRRKVDKFYVKWKGYNNLINSWIHKKSII